MYYGKAGHELHGQEEGTLMSVSFNLWGEEFQIINGGPLFKMNPSISFFVWCDNSEQVDEIWNRLKVEGKILMPLDKYPWSEKYGWVEDRFGLSWQISFGTFSDVGQRITPSLTFTGDNYGNAESALKLYTSIYTDSSVDGILRFGTGIPGEKEGNVQHAQFSINDSKMMVMDSGEEHAFTFNEAISLIQTCDTQEEIDYFWNALTKNGSGVACGWLKDEFGVAWQIYPTCLDTMLLDKDPDKVERVTNAYLKMMKFDLAALERAYEGSE